MIGFLVWLCYVRLCAYLGSKRIIGGFDGAMLGIFFFWLGIFIILSSRRLDDEQANAALIEKYESKNKIS